MSGCEVPRCGQCARWWHMGEDRYLDAVGVCGDEMVEDLGVECPPQLAVAWARTHQVGYGRRAAPRAPRTVPDAVRALADLVDVPRCRLVDRWDAARGRHYVDCTACRFGSRAEGLPEGHPMATLSRELWRTGAAEACRRCPVCGAEVERD